MVDWVTREERKRRQRLTNGLRREGAPDEVVRNVEREMRNGETGKALEIVVDFAKAAAEAAKADE